MDHTHPLTNLQQARLTRFASALCVDLHCHILPETDDGPESLEESIALARALIRDGITHAIATPHQLGRYEGRNHAVEIRARVEKLQAAFDQLKLPLKLAPGGEVRIDPSIPKLLESDVILALADRKKHLLLELPTQVPMGANSVMQHLAAIGLKIILAHAERYEMHRKDPATLAAWVDAGAIIQINAGSITGANGEKLQKMCFDWIEKGWVSVTSSDAHSTGNRRPRMTEAIDTLVSRFDESVARLICIENPSRIFNGEEVVMPVPLPPKTS